MAQEPIDLLNVPAVRSAIRQAWEDSKPGITGGHEEGGFIVRDRKGKLRIVRWPRGLQNSIILPPHPDCKIGGHDIVATFHTHPNTGSDYLQEPGETDKRAIRNDPDLKGKFYLGEFIISEAKVYLVAPNGRVSEIGDTQALLAAE